MTDPTAVPTVTLSNSMTIPAIGFGTWPLLNDAAEKVVSQALETGYRLIDTATKYGNETGVGRAIAASGLPREDIIVQSKIRGADHGEFFTPRAVDASLANLGLDYIDLYLIHWPLPRLNLYVETWKGLIAAQEAGLIRAIGVSNFLPEHLDRMIAETGVAPAVNQMELQPYFSQADMREYDSAHGIMTESWGPLGRGENDLLKDPVITSIADRLGATSAQVVLAWHMAIGTIPLPKSAHAERMAENLAAVELTLTDEDVAAITALETGQRLFDHPNDHNDEF